MFQYTGKFEHNNFYILMYIILFAQSCGGTGGHYGDLIHPDVRILIKSAVKLPLICSMNYDRLSSIPILVWD
jgi:hypothetical protein